MRNITLQITLRVSDDEVSLTQVFDWTKYAINIIAGKDIQVLTMHNVSPPEDKLGDAAKKLAVEGLLTDGGHHKQWFLERILEALGYDLAQIYDELQPDYDWEEGIAP